MSDNAYVNHQKKEAIIALRKGDGAEPNYWGRYFDYEIHISRENKKSNWYIWVYAPSGSLLYDGYWDDSKGKAIRFAIYEALRGAEIFDASKEVHT